MNIERKFEVLNPSSWEKLIQDSLITRRNGELLMAKYNNVYPNRVSTPQETWALAARDLCQNFFIFSEPPTFLEVATYVHGLLEPPF